MRKNLLHFAQHGDTSGFFPQLARWHDRERYQMFFGTLNPIWPDLRQYMDSQGVECFSCDVGGRAGFPMAMLKLASFLRRERIDILHAHLFEPSIVSLQAATLARTPVRVMTRHYSDYHTRIDKKWHVRLDQLCTRLSHRVIAVSEHTAEHMIAEEDAPPEKIRTILNGIDFDRVRLSGPDAVKRIRAEFDAEDAYILLICARMHPEKGYEYLFDAMPRIRSRTDRRVILLVAGRGTFEAEYRTRVRDLGCEEDVKFIGFRKDVPDLMAAADLVVLPSVAEAFGLVLTEALYLGTPVVASRVGGIPEIVNDGVDGVLVPPENSEALADAIIDLLHDPARRTQMSGAGRAKVVEKFQFDKMVRSYEAVYEELLIASPSPRDSALNQMGDETLS
ncbi:MAG: glycosyltransferase family 4 protein [Acidobacteriota bacterium]